MPEIWLFHSFILFMWEIDAYIGLTLSTFVFFFPPTQNKNLVMYIYQLVDVLKTKWWLN